MGVVVRALPVRVPRLPGGLRRARRRGRVHRLDELPLPYPSVTDPDQQIKKELGLRGLPGTAFYDEEGELVYLKQGPYTSEAELNADIDKYLG